MSPIKSDWERILHRASENEANAIWLNFDDYISVRVRSAFLPSLDIQHERTLYNAGLKATYRTCPVLVSEDLPRGVIFIANELDFNQKLKKFAFHKDQGKFFLLPGTDRSTIEGAGELEEI